MNGWNKTLGDYFVRFLVLLLKAVLCPYGLLVICISAYLCWRLHWKGVDWIKLLLPYE